MADKKTSCLIFYSLMCILTLEIEAQKNGFRGGAKSYEIHVEASSAGTNLHYELPESKVKAASKQDWQVDNDNAEMMAMNSPVLATVNVKHPKFSMKGQWPGYKTSFKLPKDVSVASKRTDFSKLSQGKHEKIATKSDQHDTGFSGSADGSRHHTTAHGEPAGSGVSLSNLARQLFKGRRKLGKKILQEEGVDMSKLTKLLLPIAGMKDVNLKNPHVSQAMKGVIKNARKVVFEAKTVLNDAADFITNVRKLVRVTKDHSKMQDTKDGSVVKETSSVRQTDTNNMATHSSHVSTLSQEKTKMDSARDKDADNNKDDPRSEQQSLQQNTDATRHSVKAKHTASKGNKADSVTTGEGAKGESRSHFDLPESDKERNKRSSRVHHRGLAETLESILSTINGLKGQFKYH